MDLSNHLELFIGVFYSLNITRLYTKSSIWYKNVKSCGG